MARVQLALLALAAQLCYAQLPVWRVPPRTFWANATFNPAPGVTNTMGNGYARLWANATNGRIDVVMGGTMNGITMSHIHYKTASASGIRRGLLPFAGGMLSPTMSFVGGRNWFSVMFDSSNTDITALMSEIKGSASYVNIHTEKYPNGEIQGYLKCRAMC